MVLRENNVETSNNVVPADGIITKIHNMFWLKHQTIPVQSERKEEKMSSKSGAGERQAKNKRKPRQPKESKIPSNDSQKCMGDYFAKDGKGPIRQSAWSNEKNGVQVLFPKDETAAAVAARAEQEEDDEPLRIALEESLRMSEAKSQFEAPLADCDVEEAAERSDDDDGYWERRNIQKNLPLPDTRDNKKIYDTNNNNNGNNGKNNTSVVKSMIGKIENRPGGRCITGQKDSSVNESVNKFEAAIVRSIDKPLLLPTEKPYFVDRFGRINGQNESHVYMGRGARRKEREYIEEQQQRQQQQQQPQQQQPQQQPQRQQQQRQQQQQQQQPQQQPQQQQLQRQQQQPQQQQPQRQQQQQQQPQRQQQQQQQQQSQQQPKEQGAPYVAEKTLPYYNRPMNKYDEANCNADFKNYMHGQKNGQNQTRRPTTYAEQKPFYVDKYHYSKDYSKNPRDTNERPNENQRPLPPPSPATSINNDQKHIIPEKISSSRQISKISESPITQKFQSTIETLNSNVEKLCLVDEISQVSSFPNEMKKQKSHDENSTSKCEKKIEEIIHLSDFNSRHNSPIIEEKISSPLSEPEVIMLESGTSVEFCENNFYDDDKNFTGKIDFPQCAGISYRAPPGFQCLQQQQQHEYQSSSANYATRYPVPTQNAYESLTIHDPSLIRFLLQNSRIRENIGNYDNYTPIVDNTVDIPIQSFANTSERFAFNQQDTMKNYVHSSYDPRLSLIEDDKYHDNANNRNDHNDSRYENSACFFPDNRSYDIRNNLPPNIPSCIEKTIDPSGNIIERVYLMPPQNLPNTYKKVQASLNTQQPLEDYKQFYNYENLAVPETPLLQRSTGSQQSPVASNFSPRSTGTWVNQSQPPFSNNYHQNNQQSSSHARSNVDSDNIGNNVTYDSSKFEQETLRNFSTANGRDNTQNFSNSQRPSRIPQQKLMGKGRGRGSLQQN